MTRQQATGLLQRYRDGSCSEEERKIVERWYASLEVGDTLNWTEEERELFNRALFNKIISEISEDRTNDVGQVKKITGWWKAIAAVLLLSAGLAIWTYRNNNNYVTPQLNAHGPSESQDVLPGKNGAILTLADGQRILLDTAADGSLLVQGGLSISNENGILTYDQAKGNTGPLLYNSIVTPKGRQIKMVLSDGTRVWLNAASSMYYPVYFRENNRMVEVSGEAYFEVTGKTDARGRKVPFVVRVLQEKRSPVEVTVLGTRFNVNAYEEEQDAKITLLEGAVQVGSSGIKPVLIRPGEQARVAQDIWVEKNVDIDFVMAWKYGKFSFNNADVGTIMRQAERWYDVKIVYPMGIPADTLSGGISRDVKLSQFLDIMKYSDINVKIKDGVVEVKPMNAQKK